jgi:regulator of ribonuclease activity A
VGCVRMVASASMTATSDVVDEYGDRAAVCTQWLRRFGDMESFEGTIATVRCFEDNVLVKQRVAEQGEGRVLVIDGGGSMRVALLGDMVAGAARDHGWAGLVVNGCVRDVAALREMPIGIRARGAIPRASGKRGAGEIEVPVTFGDVTFTPGAMLYSDADGIVVVTEPQTSKG